MNSKQTGKLKVKGTDSLVQKRYCRVTEIQINDDSVDDLLKGKEPSSSYLGKVVIPGTLYKLEVPIMFNKKYRFIYAILAGESKEGFCNLKLVDPEGEGMNETKAIKDIKTAAIQIFCEYANLPVPERNGGGSCDSCKHKRKAEITSKDGEMVKHTVCGLDGLVVDKDWHKFKDYIEIKDTGLIAKKEKTTTTYEHAQESPYRNARNGRYKNSTTMKSNHTDEVVNCPYYAPWFHIAEEDKWIKRESRRLPQEGSRIIGSEIIVDAEEFIDKRQEKSGSELEKLMDEMGLAYKILEKLAQSGEDKAVLEETLQLLSSGDLEEERLELLIEEIMDIRENN
ncbi:MAG: hypothetical protein ACOCVB_01790 [Bacillota bacterium]